MTDPDALWSQVVGQDVAVAQLRAAAADPVQAYLLVGPEGSGTRAAARAFAADLLASGLDQAGADRARALAATDSHPSMHTYERRGPSINAEQADEIVRRASLSPAEGSLQVLVLVDFHFVGANVAPKLLKSIEEPPPGTVFVITAEEVPPDLITIASRCVQVEFTAVAEEQVAAQLIAEGIDEAEARVAAAGAAGSMTRARILARDPEAAARRDAWYAAPARLDGTGATASAVADELHDAVDGVLAPLLELQAEESARLLARYEAVDATPPKGEVKLLEERHKREQRRVRTDELRAGLAVLTSRYRDELTRGGSAEDFLTAAAAVQELCDGLRFNPNLALQVRALMVRLPAVDSSD
jgi:DNA polymerase-3 subunit delta'